MPSGLRDDTAPGPAAATGIGGGTVHWLDTPDGLRLRAAHWPAGRRGTVLLLNGRTEFIEKYLESVAELQARGFAVWTLDWRGQGLSSRLLPDPVLNHAVRFADMLADLDLLLDRLVLPGLEGRALVMLAHSMGGHLGALALARRPGVFTRAVLSAPMIDFRRHPALRRPLMQVLLRLALLRPGVAARHGPGTSRLPPLDRPFAGNPLTACPVRYAADVALQRADPRLQGGGATWGWQRAAADSVADLHRPGVARSITLPVLLLLAGQERLVDNRALRRFARRLPDAELVEVPGARHELLREHDRHRHQVWAAIDRFLVPVGTEGPPQPTVRSGRSI